MARPQHQPARSFDAHTNRRNYSFVASPETPTLLRLPSNGSTARSTSPRRLTNPLTPALLSPTNISASSATSPSYFSPQPASHTKEVRSPGARRPPASFSVHGLDTTKGPPITLITRGNSDIARRTSQHTSDFTLPQQQQLAQSGSGSVSSNRVLHTSREAKQRRNDADNPGASVRNNQINTPTPSRQNSTETAPRLQPMARSVDDSSDYDSVMRSQSGDSYAPRSRYGTGDAAGNDGSEDLFLNIAEDNTIRAITADVTSRSDRLRVSPTRRLPTSTISATAPPYYLDSWPADPQQSRIARASTNRQSLPSAISSSTSAQPNATTTNGSRLPAAIDTKEGSQYRRSSLLHSSTRNTREQSPLTPSYPIEAPRPRVHELSPKRSFPARPKDSDLSPKEFLASLEMGKRRPSYPDALQTPPNRSGTYKPSNLHYYSSSRDNPTTPHVDTPQEARSRHDGTESHDSTGPATSVWDELGELKSRLQKLEMGGKMPATSGAAVAQASADRPRTANTSVTTVSSSPNQQRKPPSTESIAAAPLPTKVHPLLGEALAKAKQHVAPAVYRALEATVTEALALAEQAGSAGLQGTLQSASSILNGTSVSDRQVRRKADNICRSLTELCIELCDNKSHITSPAMNRALATGPSRRPSVQVNGESPTVKQSIEPESDTLPRTSPSRALSRIEARRSSMMAARDSSQEPPTPSQSNIPSRLDRSGTSLYRTHRKAQQEDDDPTIRAPSRALTDFRDARTKHKARFSREYTSNEPMPDLQPSPALQTTTSIRRPTVSGVGNENNLLYHDNNRRYGADKQTPQEPTTRTAFSSNRNSIGGSFPLGRSASLSRRVRGTSAAE